jgi:Ca-activated chloride channel homolog
MRWNRFLTVAVVVSLLIAGRAAAAERGLLLHNDRIGTVAAPVQGTAVEVRVTGIIARARITQIFTNPTREWLEGIYIFPLPEGAAVDTLRMTVGDRVIEGVVQEKAAARQTYEAAKQQGTKAALIEEQRAGVFTTSLANIGPGETVEVAIELQQIVSYRQGRFNLTFPMLLAPQYVPPDQSQSVSGMCQPPVRAAGTPPVNPFAIHVDLAPGFPLGPIESPTHKIAVARGKGKDGRERYAVDLAGGTAFADGDFVLEWKPAVGREPRAVYFSEEIDGEQYSLLMVMPPDDPDAFAARLPRETVFIIDTSGSMEGTSLDQARRALGLGLQRLQPGDWFNVIQFNSTASALFPANVPADAGHLAQAQSYVAGLQSTGGTEMLPALQIALGQGAPRPGLVPQVIFVTDGQVGNDAELLDFIGKTLGERRLFTVAIGSAPNAAFLRRAAEMGRGSFTAITSIEQVESGMGALLAQLESPMLRQIDIRWADPSTEAWPARVPDLYLGEPLVVTSRQDASGPVAVSGLRNGRDWADELPAAATIKGAGIDKLWARKKIDSLLDSLAAGISDTADAAKADDVRRQVTELGLHHHLITPYTSLVSVDVEPTAPAGVHPATRVLPVNPPRGTQPAPDPADYDTEDVITVLGESPLLDERRISTGATVTGAELERIPAARDPWAVLQSTPGVLTDRINLGGNEGGLQANYVSPGSSANQNSWSIDGVVITDVSALGSSPGYYNFEAFEEMQVRTGGADTTQPTPGVQVNMITKRGTNEWRASADAVRSNETLQADHGAQSNRLADLFSWGLESGGPVRRDSAWIWGAANRADTRRIAFGGQTEKNLQSGGALKVNLQVGEASSVTLLASRGDISGSGLGAGPDRAPETTWNRDGADDHWKAESTRIFSASFFLTATAGRSLRRLRDDPAQTGGEARIDEDGIIHGSWFGRGEDLRSDTARLDSSTFFNWGQTSHELKISAENRRQRDLRKLPAPIRILVKGRQVGLPSGVDLSEEWRSGDIRAATGTTGLWVQDTVSYENLNAILGLRLDEQDLGIAGGPAPRTLTPRLGLTWTPDPERRTLLRSSLSRYASRLGDRAAVHIDPAAPAVTYYSFLPDGGEPVSWYAEGFGNQVDPHLRPEITDEAVLGLDRSLRPEFIVGLQATWRRTRHLLEERLLIRDASNTVRPATVADWQPAGTLTGLLPDGTPYAVPYFDLLPGLTPSGGRLLTNGDRRQDVLGLTLSWQKRLSDGWLSRGHVTWQDWSGHLGSDFIRYDDPTNTLGSGDDDGQIAPRNGFDGVPHQEARFLGGRWSFAASGLVQLAGFDLSASVNGREGGPLPYYRSIARDRAGLAAVQLTGRVDTFHTRDLVTVDTRINRDFDISDLRISCGLDVFNLFDERSVAARELDLGLTRGARPIELTAPRTLRLGLRLSWR